MAGVSREYISRLESGKVALTEEIKAKLTDALDKLNPENPLEMVLDYVRIRFPSQDVKHVVEDILKIRLDVMIHEDFGFYSYSEHYVLGDVFVLTSPDEEKGTLLELKGKLDSGTLSAVSATVPNDTLSDIQNALLALGYSEKETLVALKQIPGDCNVSDGIKMALKALSKG